MKTTILGGVLFLIPIAFVAIILDKAFAISMIVAKPLDSLIPIERVAGVAMANIIAIILILAVCFLAGLVARGSMFSKHVARLDNFLIDIIPGYAVVKSIISGVAKTEDAATLLQPVLVKFDDYDQIAFQVEQQGDKCVVFLPGSPSAWSGASIIVSKDRVTPLDLPAHQVVSLLRVMGRGSAKWA